MKKKGIYPDAEAVGVYVYMKKGTELQGTVLRVDFPNKGIVNTELGDVVCKNTTPGQQVHIMVNKVRHGKAEARLLEVTKKADGEIESVCPHFGVCGGCNYLNVSYEDELEIKKGQIERLLTPILCKQGSNVSDVYEGINESPIRYEYRNKMEFSFGDACVGGDLELGMHKRGGFYDVVSVTGCKIVDEDYRKILSETLSYFRGKDTSYYHKMKHIGFLRHLLVRKAYKTGEILVDIVTTSQKPVDTICTEKSLMEDFADALLSLKLDGTLVGILHTTNDSMSDTVKDDGTKILYGRDFFYEELLGMRFKITPFSFFQTNSLGAEVLYSTARELILEAMGLDGTKAATDKKTTIFDLYSGTGTIAQMMAPVATKVIGVEIVEEAVEAAKENAKLNGLNNCEFIAGDVLKVIDEIEDKPDFIILDPPRDGIHPKALPKIIDYGVDNILYISCKPTSLVRDLDVFLDNGYSVKKAVAINQFPGTSHVETVCLLSKLHEAKHHVSVKMDMDDMKVIGGNDGIQNA